jgi:hypothetical protein
MDVLRLDTIKMIDPNASQCVNQAISYRLKWQDGPNDDPNTKRKLKTIKIVNPDDDAQWIKLDIIERMSIIRPHSSQGLNQRVNYVFANGDDNTARQSDVATVYNTDVSSLDMTAPVDWTRYQPVLMAGTQDTSHSLVVEIPNRFKMTDPHASQGLNQGVKYVKPDVKDAIGRHQVPEMPSSIAASKPSLTPPNSMAIYDSGGAGRDKAAQGVGIAWVALIPEPAIRLTAHGYLPPVGPLPTATFAFRGAWTASTPYLVNDTFSEGGSGYVALVQHTSAATFDPNATDGTAHNLYGLYFSSLSSLPAGGETGAALVKTTSADYAVTWSVLTLAGLSDVLQSPSPVTGDLVQWNGSHFALHFARLHRRRTAKLGRPIRCPRLSSAHCGAGRLLERLAVHLPKLSAAVWRGRSRAGEPSHPDGHPIRQQSRHRPIFGRDRTGVADRQHHRDLGGQLARLWHAGQGHPDGDQRRGLHDGRVAERDHLAGRCCADTDLWQRQEDIFVLMTVDGGTTVYRSVISQNYS